ncbi:hypothetical protein BOX15_Mlig009825g1, partial [Macrostomum lignano]
YSPRTEKFRQKSHRMLRQTACSAILLMLAFNAIDPAAGLRCHSASNAASPDGRAASVNCVAGYDYCIRFSVAIGGRKSYYRACYLDKDGCSSLTALPNYGDCSVCSADNCN